MNLLDCCALAVPSGVMTQVVESAPAHIAGIDHEIAVLAAPTNDEEKARYESIKSKPATLPWGVTLVTEAFGDQVAFLCSGVFLSSRFVCLSICRLSVCTSIVCICLSVCACHVFLPVCLFVCLSVCVVQMDALAVSPSVLTICCPSSCWTSPTSGCATATSNAGPKDTTFCIEPIQ
jgi:hypothetical protein